ncbi:MAG: tetratricopeptide repeat protein [Hyphomicrobiaceae bacterium]|nr:tetratricopeptide repeat protein [Hyphomicrobiaceae bacterium]
MPRPDARHTPVAGAGAAPHHAAMRRPLGRAGLLAAAASALITGGCAQSGLQLPIAGFTDAAAPLTTGSIGSSASPLVGTDVPGAIAKARELKAAGSKTEALDHLDAAAASAPDDRNLARERGLLALELGRTKDAETLLQQAHDPAAPDWQTLSALGSALAASGRQKEAQARFAEALKLAPNHPSILNNLALSYALDGQRDRAVAVLRQAAGSGEADPRTRQNLALLLGLDGKTEEARKVAASVLPPGTAAANLAYLDDLRSRAGTRSPRKEAPASLPKHAGATAGTVR